MRVVKINEGKYGVYNLEGKKLYTVFTSGSSKVLYDANGIAAISSTNKKKINFRYIIKEWVFPFLGFCAIFAMFFIIACIKWNLI